jgi:hypothetical protein
MSILNVHNIAQPTLGNNIGHRGKKNVFVRKSTNVIVSESIKKKNSEGA